MGRSACWELGADEDEQRWEEKLKKVATPNTDKPE